jgi:perosamine synthetase
MKRDRESSWHLYPIRLNLQMLTKNRAQIIDELKKFNVGVGVHFMPVHQHLYYNETFKLDDKNYPVASASFPRLMSLPIYPGMTEQNVQKVITTLIDILNKFRR